MKRELSGSYNGYAGITASSNNAGLRIQPKLTVGPVDDPLEQEADGMADQVMRMPEPNFIQRKCSCGEDEEVQRKPLHSFIQKKVAGHSHVTGDSTHNQIQATRGGGNTMPANTRTFMESRFGVDFSGVRIHSGGYAAELSNELNAQAFTVGNDIYFNKGKYSPDSSEGKRLLAHELTHTVQKEAASLIQPLLIQRKDLAIPPAVAGAVPKTLSASEKKSAITWNKAAFSDVGEVSLLRELLSLNTEPSVIDEDFVTALVQYQANYGITQDGLLGAGTATRLADELGAEATNLGTGADIGSGTQLALNPAQRRTRLRSQVVSRLGQMLHQGFIGSKENPSGIVTVRSGFNDPNVAAPGPRDTNTIGINYTGANVANSRWLQFAFRQMSAIDPTTKNRVFHTGGITTTGGTHDYSSGTNFAWNVDTVPATNNMYYEAGGGNQRTGAHTEIFDQPAGWNVEADNFAASFATRPGRVRLINGFDTYLVVNNNSVVYHARWNVYFDFNTSVIPTPDINGTYEVLTAGSVNRLPADRKAALDAQFAGNNVP